MCDCFHLAFPNWHAASSETGVEPTKAEGGGRRLRGAEPVPEDNSICDEPSQFTEGERPRPQGSSPVEEYPEMEKYTDSDKECDGEHDPHRKGGSGKKSKKSGLGSMFEKRSSAHKISKLKEAHSPESEVIVKTAQDGCAEGLVYGGGGREGLFIKEVVPESPASKNLKLKEGDQLLSATVYFDNVPYEDAIQILEHAQAYKVKLCLKRKPDIAETEPIIDSDVIPEEDAYAPEMREHGKTKRRSDARISWPKFHTLGRKSNFTRSHSSSEADEQRKLELSPTTSDTESPIKSQDALRGKKKNKLRLSFLKKRGRISSTEDQDTDTPTTGQISGKTPQTHETSDMLSPEGLESPTEESPEIYVTEDLKVVEDLRPEQNDQKVSHKMELITIDSTLKTEDLTVALAAHESPSGTKSPDGKKKKKERSELKMKILGKDKSHKKDAKAKSSPKRLKTLGASFEIADEQENDKSNVIQNFETLKEITGDEQELDAKMELNVPKLELELSEVAHVKKSPKKGEKSKKSKDGKQKEETKTSQTFKLPKIGFSDITTEKDIQKMNLNVEKGTARIEHPTEDTHGKEDPYERLSKSSLSRTQLPKREDIEIPGMEDMSLRTTAKGIKENNTVFTGQETPSEIELLAIDVDSVKEAVSKLPGFKLPKVDMSGVPIPEEITVIDANAQRISVKTPTKVVDTKTKHETHFTKFDISASSNISNTTVRLPKITTADLTSEVLLVETNFKKPEMKYKTEAHQHDIEIKTKVYKREDIIIPGKESAEELAILQAQEDKKSRKEEETSSFGIAMPDIKTLNIGIDLSKQQDDNLIGERTIFLQEEQTSKSETKKVRGVISSVKMPEIDGIEYIDSVGDSPAEKEGGMKLTDFGVNLDAAKPNVDMSFPGIRSKVTDAEVRIDNLDSGAITSKIGLHLPDAEKGAIIDGMDIKSPEKEGHGAKFKIPNLGISMPKMKGPKIDMGLSKKDANVKLSGAKAEVEVPEVPEPEVTIGRMDVSIPQQKIKVQKPILEIKPQQTGHELDREGLKIKMPDLKGPQFDFNVSKKDVSVSLPDAKVEVKLPEAPEIDVSLAKVDVSVPEQKTEVKKPELEIKPLQTEVEHDRKGAKIKMPKFGMAEAKAKLPDASSVEPSAKVEVKVSRGKGAEKNVEISPSKYKMPTFKLPKFGGSTANTDVDIPIPETQLKTLEETGAVDITAPNIDIESPSLDIKKTQTEFDGKGSKFKMPKFGISIPKVKGPEIDLKVSQKEFDLPKAKSEVKLPEVEHTEHGIKVEIKAPEFKVGQKDVEAKLKMATDVNIPEEGLNDDIAASSIDTGFDMKTTRTDLDGKGSKFKMPHLGFSMPKAKGPKFDFSASKKGIDMKLPEIEADVKLPEADLGKVDVSIPEIKNEFPDARVEVKLPETAKIDVEMKSPEFEADRGAGKFKMPKFAINLPKLKGPEIDWSSKREVDLALPQTKGEVNLPHAPTVDVGIGKAEVSIPELEIKKPEAGVELDGQGDKFQMPNFGITIPKVKGPDIDLKFPKKDVDGTLPEAGAELKLPEVDLKKPADVEMKGPKIAAEANLKIPKDEIDIVGPSLDLKITETEGKESKFKVPKFGISLPKVQGPKIDISSSKKGVDVKLPDAKTQLPEVPEIDAKLGKVDISISEAMIEVKKPQLDIKPVQTEGELDGQEGKFKLPKFGISMPKVKGPEIDFSLSEKNENITLPEVKAEVDLPDLNLKDKSAKVEIKAPETEVQSSSIKASPSKFKMPTFKLPKFGLATPNITTEVSDIDTEIKIEGPDTQISVAHTDIDVPVVKAEVQMPEIEIKESSSDIVIDSQPGVEVDVKMKKPKFSLPSFSFSKSGVKAPELDVRVQDMDVSIPEGKVKVKGGEIGIKSPESEAKVDGEGRKFKIPKFGITIPEVTGPEIDLSLSKKEVDVGTPDAKAEVKLPEFEMKKSSATVEIKSPEIKMAKKDTEGSPSKYKMPTFKLPKFGVGLPSGVAEASETHKDVDVRMPEEVLKVEIAVPSIDTEGSSIDVTMTGTEQEVKGRKFKMPKLGITVPKVTGPEFNLSMSKGDMDVTFPEATADIKLPEVEQKEPSAEMEIKAPEVKVSKKDKEGSPSKFKMPTFKLPKFGVSTPSATVDLPDTNKDLRIDGADIKIPEEVLKVDIAAPSIDIEGPSIDMKTTETEHEGKGSKFKMPKFGITMPKVTGPEIDLSLQKKDIDMTLPEAKAEVRIPDVELKEPSAKVEMEAPEVKVSTKDKDGSPSKFKMPTFKLPKFGIGMPSATVKLPDTNEDLEIDGADIKIPEEVITVDIAAPSIDIEGPSLEMKSTETEQEGKGSKFKMPKFGITMPKVTGPEIDLSFSKKDGDMTLPEATAEVKHPEVELKKPSAELEITAPEIKVATKEKEGSPLKFKLPTFKLPKIGVSGPSATAELPETNKDLEIAGADITIPEESLKVQASSVDIEGPSFDMKTEHEGKGGKFKMPKFGITMPKMTGPEIDLSLSKKDADVTLPEAKAEVKLPVVELKEPSAKVEIETPEVKVSTKDKEGSPSKFKMPTFKLPKFGVGMPSVTAEVPDADADIKIDGADIKIPEEVLKVDIAAPSIDIEGPSITMKTTETEHEGKGSKFKIPKFGITMPKMTGPEIDLSLSKKDADVTLPEAKAEVKLPDVELKEPSAKVEIETPEVKVSTKAKEGSPSKFKMPTFKLPKFGVGMPSVTAEVPDTNKDLQINGADIKFPEEVLEVDIAAPSIDIEGPSLTIKTTETEYEGKGSKFKMPKFGITMPKMTGPEIDLSLSKKDADVTLPEAKAEVKLPVVELKEPSAKVEIEAPEVKVSTKDKDGSPSKFKMPTFKLPKFGVGMPSVTAEVPGTDADVKIDGADMTVPEGVLKVDIAAPSIDIEGPSITMKTTETEHEGKGGKFKMPKFGITMPKMTGPEIDLSLSKKDADVTLPGAKAEVKLPVVELKEPSAKVEIETPEVKVATKDKEGSPSKFKMPSFKLPKFGVGMPSVTAEVPDTDADIKIDGADIKIPEEVLKVDIAAPSIDIEGPSVTMKTTETEHEGKGSKFKMPKFGITMPKVTGPEIDLSLSKKDQHVTLPEAKAEVKLPDFELKEPSAKVEVETPELKLSIKDKEGSPSKFKMPTFKLPKFGVGMPSATVELPETKEIKMDGADVKIQEEVLKVDIAASSVDIEGPSIDMKTEQDAKGGKFKMPKFGITMPKVTGPEIDLSLSKKDGDMTLPEATAEVKLPEVELKKPSAELEITAPEIKVATKEKEGSPSKFKMPSFKLPKFGVSTPGVTAEVPDTDADIKIDGADIKSPEQVFKVDIAAPSIDIEGPSVTMKTTETEKEVKGSKFKMPSLGFTVNQGKQTDVDLCLSKKDVQLTESSAKVEMMTPVIDVQASNIEGSPTKFKMPTFKLPKFGGATAQVSMEVPDVDKNTKSVGHTIEVSKSGATVGVSGPNIDNEGLCVDMKAKGSEMEGSESKFKLPSLGISVPKVKGPEIDKSLSKKEDDVTLPEAKGEVKLPEVKEAKVAIAEPDAPEVEGDGKLRKQSWTFPKFSFSRTGAKAPDADVDLETTKVEVSSQELTQQDIVITQPKIKAQVKLPDLEIKSSSSVDIKVSEKEAAAEAGASSLKLKGPSIDTKTDVAIPDVEIPNNEVESLGSPSKFKLPSFKMPRLSFSKPKPEDIDTEGQEYQQEIKVEAKEESKSPKMSLSSFGDILKKMELEFDVGTTDTAEENLEKSKEVHKTEELVGKRLEDKEKETHIQQDVTRSPERTGWFKFPKFGLSSPSEPPKDKEEKSPEGKSVDDTISPTGSVQSSDAFADISSAMTSEHTGLSTSSPTKVTVKYSDPNTAMGLGEGNSQIITSTTRTELISVEPNLPEKITILSSGVSSSSEDTLRLESGKIHVITSNIEAAPEAQHAKLLTTLQVQSAGGLPIMSDSNAGASWTVEDSQSSKKTIFERRSVTETSSERSETIVITKQITRMLDSAEHISGETATSIQRLKDTVHSEKMKFFDEVDK